MLEYIAYRKERSFGMFRSRVLPSIIALAILLGLIYSTRWIFSEPDFVVRQGGYVFIVDRTGERWEISQAESIGMTPGKFRFGLGREAFTPLGESALAMDTEGMPGKARVIGVSSGSGAGAFSVEKLKSHEVANVRIEGKPVAVGY